MSLICNSIPKSGTYLLASLAQFCGYKDSMLRYLDHGTNIVDIDNHLLEYKVDHKLKRFLALENMKYSPCHLTYDADLDCFLAEKMIKHLFIFRHPGDIIYSYVRFVTYSDSFRKHSKDTLNTQENMKNNFESDEERFIHVFFNMKNSFNFSENIGWLQSTSCLPICFEKFYAELIELQDNKVGPEIERIFDYLNVNTKLSPSKIFEKIYGQGPTFRSGTNKVGQFEKLDRDKISIVLDDSEYQRYLTIYGYN